jgi:hypothetical protein
MDGMSGKGCEMVVVVYGMVCKAEGLLDAFALFLSDFSQEGTSPRNEAGQEEAGDVSTGGTIA